MIMKNEKKNNALVFIPTYNEAGNVDRLYQSIKNLIACDILFCDDNSPDGTGKILDSLAQKDKSIRIIHRPYKMGLGTAHKEAFKYAYAHKYEMLITMDADFTHDPSYLPLMIERKNDADIIIGSRYASGGKMSGWNKIRLPLTYLWKDAIKYGLNMPYDCTGAFRLYKVNLLTDENSSSFKSRGFAFNMEVLYRFKQQGAKILEIPIHAKTRVHGKSKVSLRIIVEMLQQYIVLIFDRMFFAKKILKEKP